MRLYPHIPQPFVLITEMGYDTAIRSDQPFHFGVRLFGKAIELFPYIVYSFLEIGKQGLGKDSIPFRIDSITQPMFDKILYQDGATCLGKFEKENLLSLNLEPEKDLTVEFMTPVKIQTGGQKAESIDFETLIKAAMRRISILSYFYGTPVDTAVDFSGFSEGADKIKKTADYTRMYEFSRFSGRQKKMVPLNGIVGKVVFSGQWRRFRSLLELACVCNIGKATSFGFGRMQLSQE